MYRRVVISSQTDTSGDIGILYHVRGAALIFQQRGMIGKYNAGYPPGAESFPSVYADVVRLKIPASVGNNRYYEFIFNVSENQPVEESVEEITSTGITITVYNEHGVLVCRNVPKTPASNPTQAVGPGEMTSVPGEEPGEMTSESISGTGEMI